MTALILSALLAAGPLELEESGALAQAGAAWQEEGDLEGQARVLGRLLEEALYAGHANRAEWLVEDLEAMGCDSSLVLYWRARLAWTCGLERLAVEWLERVEGEPWLEHRAAGTAFVYRGMGEEACTELTASLRAGSTRRRRFLSAVDLCFALLQAGRTEDALELSSVLADCFPGEGLAVYSRAMVLHSAGSDGQAVPLLESLVACEAADPAMADLAGGLLEVICR